MRGGEREFFGGTYLCQVKKVALKQTNHLYDFRSIAGIYMYLVSGSNETNCTKTIIK